MSTELPRLQAINLHEVLEDCLKRYKAGPYRQDNERDDDYAVRSAVWRKYLKNFIVLVHTAIKQQLEEADESLLV